MNIFTDSETGIRILNHQLSDKKHFLNIVRTIEKGVENILSDKFKNITCNYNEQDINYKKLGVCNLFSISIDYDIKHYFKAVDFQFYFIQSDNVVYIEPVVKYRREILESTVINDNHYRLTDFSSELAVQYINHSLYIIFQLKNEMVFQQKHTFKCH